MLKWEVCVWVCGCVGGCAVRWQHPTPVALLGLSRHKLLFCRFLGLGHLRGLGVSLGRILGVPSIEPADHQRGGGIGGLPSFAIYRNLSQFPAFPRFITISRNLTQSRNFPQFIAIYCNFPQFCAISQISHKFPQFPAIYLNLSQFPTSSCNFRNLSQFIAIYCNFSQFIAISRNFPAISPIYRNSSHFIALYGNLLQFPAIFCNLSQTIAISCNFPQFIAISCNFPQFPAVYHNLQQFSGNLSQFFCTIFPQFISFFAPFLHLLLGCPCCVPVGGLCALTADQSAFMSRPRDDRIVPPCAHPVMPHCVSDTAPPSSAGAPHPRPLLLPPAIQPHHLRLSPLSRSLSHRNFLAILCNSHKFSSLNATLPDRNPCPLPPARPLGTVNSPAGLATGTAFSSGQGFFFSENMEGD